MKKVYSKKIRRIEGNRKKSVIVGELRNSHCPKTKYYRHKIGIEANAACKRCWRLRKMTI